MSEFIEALRTQEFLRHALATGLLVSVACGVVGTYVVTRRISYIAGAIAHSVLGGLGAAGYLKAVQGWTWLEPVHGAILAALMAAALIGLVSLRGSEREDSVIGAIWAIGMAVGVVFVSKTPGYATDLMRYLFGNILLVSRDDLWLIGALDLLVVGLGVAFYRQFLAVCFDEEFARLRGVKVEFYYLLLLGLTALTVVLLVMVVGLVMVIALLTLPVAVAGHFSRRLWQMMVISTGLCALLTSGGLAVSYSPDLPPGATIILLAGAVYLLTVVGAGLGKKLYRSASRAGPGQVGNTTGRAGV
ncbi:MAG: metal ABC transporter permease [Phycisphaerae bacterium]